MGFKSTELEVVPAIPGGRLSNLRWYSDSSPSAMRPITVDDTTLWCACAPVTELLPVRKEVWDLHRDGTRYVHSDEFLSELRDEDVKGRAEIYEESRGTLLIRMLTASSTDPSLQ